MYLNTHSHTQKKERAEKEKGKKLPKNKKQTSQKQDFVVHHHNEPIKALLAGSLHGVHVVPEACHEVADLDLAVKVVLLYPLGTDAKVERKVKLLLDRTQPVRQVRREVQRVREDKPRLRQHHLTPSDRSVNRRRAIGIGIGVTRVAQEEPGQPVARE